MQRRVTVIAAVSHLGSGELIRLVGLALAFVSLKSAAYGHFARMHVSYFRTAVDTKKKKLKG